MNWLKRNLIFVILAAVAVALIGAAGFYIFKSMSRNSAAYDHLTELYNTMRQAANGNPSPGNGKIDNTQTAKDQTAELQQWIRQAKIYFAPIAPIPTNSPLGDAAFAYALHGTISQLQHDAEVANVTVTTNYNFSFQAQSDKVRFAPPGSVDKLAVQLGEVKAITEIIFGAHVNVLEGIQRLRVSDDDQQGQPTDYIDTEQPITTDLATLTPYQVTFDGFSDQIADVLTAFATSPHGYVIKSINVQPANNGAAPPPAPIPGRGGLETILSEQMLRVTLLVEVVKLSPGR
jgi:flagellar basal body-associated protein FliL